MQLAKEWLRNAAAPTPAPEKRRYVRHQELRPRVRATELAEYFNEPQARASAFAEGCVECNSEGKVSGQVYDLGRGAHRVGRVKKHAQTQGSWFADCSFVAAMVHEAFPNTETDGVQKKLAEQMNEDICLHFVFGESASDIAKGNGESTNAVVARIARYKHLAKTMAKKLQKPELLPVHISRTVNHVVADGQLRVTEKEELEFRAANDIDPTIRQAASLALLEDGEPFYSVVYAVKQEN